MIEEGSIHLWNIDLRLGEARIEEYESVLSQDERERAKQYLFKPLERAFVVGRATVRRILGAYLNQNPRDLVFRYNRFGKPSISDGGIEFSLSHSGETGLLAITKDTSIGIDIEENRTVPSQEAIARHSFSEAEIQTFLSLKPKERHLGFLKIFTRKEAVLKAMGCGLTENLRQIEVGFSSMGSGWVNVFGENFRVRDISIGPMWTASLAHLQHEGEDPQIRFFDFPKLHDLKSDKTFEP